MTLNAWGDPELVRLSEFRSWWDANSAGPAVRGPLDDAENPWLTDEHPDRDPSAQPPSRAHRPPREDPLAASRCACSHISYADEYPGCFCRFCLCTDHRPAGVMAA